MDQNFNCCFSDWIKRTKYKQCRCGSKPENSPPFTQHHKSLKKNPQYMKHSNKLKISAKITRSVFQVCI